MTADQFNTLAQLIDATIRASLAGKYDTPEQREAVLSQFRPLLTDPTNSLLDFTISVDPKGNVTQVQHECPNDSVAVVILLQAVSFIVSGPHPKH
jgi:hypothetical protein